MANYTHPTTSRPPIKTISAEQEEASQDLKLGDFQHTPTLSWSEARLIIEAVVDRRRQNSRRFQETEVMVKMNEYLDDFARFKRKETIEEIDVLLAGHPNIESFERSQLASLCCETYEEAKTLIPSLANKIGDAELQELLDEITKKRNFVE